MSNEENELERAERLNPVESADDQATNEAKSFGELREKHQHVQFWIAFLLAVSVCINLYTIFFYWATHKELNQNWHVGLMLVVPATTILLMLVQILKYRHTKEKDEEHPQIFPLIKQLLEEVKSWLNK